MRVALDSRAAFGLVLWLGVVASPVAAQHPEIRKLDRSDLVFRQLQDDIGTYHRTSAAGEPVPPLVIYSFTAEDGDLLALSARLSLPYDAVATLNGFESLDDLKEGQSVLIPSMPGLFVPLEPQSDFQEILVSSSLGRRADPYPVVVRDQAGERTLVFFAGSRFNAVERAFFLQILFRYPLVRRGSLSSGYGPRRDPFTGTPNFHGGIDLAAPGGTEVVAAREGRVVGLGRDDTYGNYLIIEHIGGYQTLYGHLSRTMVSLNQEVRSGMIIGEVGTTGLTTGPHLHFEIRRKGAWRDPLPLIR